MGFLRKIGRKINKKLGKIFGSKLGAVIGTVGMFMLMGTVTKGLTGWAKSAFGGAADASAQLATTASADAVAASSVGATGTAAEQLAVTASADAVAASSASAGVTGNAAQQLATTLPAAGAEIAASTGQAAVGAEVALAEKALLAGENSSLLAGSGSSVIPQNASQQATSASSLTQAEQIANMTNNMDQANAAISAIDSASVTGSLNVSPTITDSIIQDAIPAIEQNAAVVKSNIAELASSTDSLSVNLNAVSPPTFTPEPNSIQMMDTKAKDLAGNAVGGLDTSAIKDFKSTPIDIDAAYAQSKNIFAKGADKLKGYFNDDFVGDTIQGVTTGVLMGALQEEPEDVGGYGRMPGAPAMEAAQGNYVQAVAPSAMAATGMTRPLSFQELAKQTLYGTGSPNYLSQFYQPLATPTTQGMG